MKIKSNSSAKKRVKITGTGKKMFKKSAKKHLLSNKSKRQKKLDMGGKMSSKADRVHLARLLPHS